MAVFPDPHQAEAALTTLHEAGLDADQVGLAARSDTLVRATGLLAPLSTPDEGPFDVLVELGVPPDAARLYQQSFDAHQALVAVRAPIDGRVLERKAPGRVAERAARRARASARQRARQPARDRRGAHGAGDRAAAAARPGSWPA
jgi:hypothetical protein